MKTEQKKWTEKSGWVEVSSSALSDTPQVVFVFGATAILQKGDYFKEVKSFYPDGHILSCSTAGEILDVEVSDDSLALTAVHFDKTNIKFSETDINDANESEEAGKKLADSLDKDDLAHVMVFTDGLKVNGTALVKGLVSNLPSTVSVTGGLVGDGSNFKHTLVGIDKIPTEGKIVLMGMYGSNLKVGYGSLGGWDIFGPERMITKSRNNILYELDGKPALTLYKEYLGDQAEGLPGTGLLFPLALRLKTDSGTEVEVVRTILAVDEKNQSMTFAGDMPEGIYARLMKANFDRLVDGASGAASMSAEPFGSSKAELAILISCIGRKLVLKERTFEELEAVREKIGPQAAMVGFYSYGEICPTAPTEKQCQLHNQTMTITLFREE